MSALQQLLKSKIVLVLGQNACVFPFYNSSNTLFSHLLGSSFVVSEGSYLDISDWLNPAKLSLYYQINATSPWVRDLCGQRTTDACEQLCDQETGKGGWGGARTLEMRRRRLVSGYLDARSAHLCVSLVSGTKNQEVLAGSHSGDPYQQSIKKVGTRTAI